VADRPGAEVGGGGDAVTTAVDREASPVRWTHRGWLVAASALLTFGLVDALRVWLPSIVHVAGDTGAMPPARLALIALAWFLLPVPVAVAARRVGPRPLWRGGVLTLALARIALQATDGGRPQLLLAGLCVVGAGTALVALAAGTPSGHLARVGVVLGLAAEGVRHALLGTVDLLWRDGFLATLAVVVLAAALVGAAEQARTVPLWWPSAVDEEGEVAAVWTRGSAWPWLAVGPSVLLTGVLVAAPARLELAAGIGPRGAVLALAVAGAAGVSLAALGPRIGAPVTGTIGGVLVVLCTLGALRPVGVASALAQLGLLVGIGAVLGAPGTTPGDSGPRRRGLAAATSLLLFLTLGSLHYGAYWLAPGAADDVSLVLAAGGLAVVAVAAGLAGRGLAPPTHVPMRGLLAAAAGLLLIGLASVPLVGASAAVSSSPTPFGPPGTVRIATYPVNAGYDADGRFDVAAVVATILATDADVIVLNEVDRGRLLEGGHDVLRLVRDATGMRAVFAPSSDALRGEAVLTRLPVTGVRTATVPGGSAAARRGVVSVTLDTGAGSLAVVGTHLHAVAGEPQVRLAQARTVAAEVTRLRGADRPVVLAGDLSAAWSAPELEPLRFLADAAPESEPVAAADAQEGRTEHVLVSPDLVTSDPRVVPSTAAGHRAVAVTVTMPAVDG
jgi:endonuclease/exonuclease/phosphatase family metal-dependent hydrolase